MKSICPDLRLEYESLDAVVALLDEQQWQQVTPFGGWSIYDQVAHLYYSDGNALLAMENASAFKSHALKLTDWLKAGNSLMAFTYAEMGQPPVAELLSEWRGCRASLLQKAEAFVPTDRIAWYGPSMSARSMITARLMETWAHGQSICDTLKVSRQNTDRLRHIAHLGVKTWQWSFITNKLEPPTASPFVELTAPSGELWRWGDEAADDVVKGSAVDFCLLVTRCRNWQDLALECTGADALTWLPIAQCFAGAPQPAPGPGERV